MNGFSSFLHEIRAELMILYCTRFPAVLFGRPGMPFTSIDKHHQGTECSNIGFLYSVTLLKLHSFTSINYQISIEQRMLKQNTYVLSDIIKLASIYKHNHTSPEYTQTVLQYPVTLLNSQCLPFQFPIAKSIPKKGTFRFMHITL